MWLLWDVRLASLETGTCCPLIPSRSTIDTGSLTLYRDDAKVSVTGFRDCKFQAFTRLNEARVYWDNNCCRNHKMTHHPELKPTSASPSSSALSNTSPAPDALLIPAAPPTVPFQCLFSPTSQPLPSPPSAGTSNSSTPLTALHLVNSSPRLPPTYSQHTQHVSSTRHPVSATLPLMSAITSHSSLPNLNSTPSSSKPSLPMSPTSCTTSRGFFTVGTVHGVAIIGLHVIYSDRCVLSLR